jgi:hypothetical protein
MEKAKSTFKTKLLRPAKADTKDPWTFVILPKKASDILSRRGRTTVQGTLNGAPFQVTLEPDGQLSHWMRVDEKLRKAADAEVGDEVTVQISPVEEEPDPVVPADFQKALKQSPDAESGWEKTTHLARLDWVHWIESAKQEKTREKRIAVACDKLAHGKLRVCCFDPSGYYDKSKSAPEEAQ